MAFFFFQAEDGIRDLTVTGVQTCALPISFGEMPPMGTSEPGQNVEAERRFWRRAVTQIGSPPHHRWSLAVRAVSENRSGQLSSAMLLAMMPWCSGYRPVTIV